MSPVAAVASLLGLALLLMVVAALARALATPRARPPAPPLPAEALEAAAGIEEKVAVLVRRPTVSWFDPGRLDMAAFDGLKADLVRLFPRVHAALDRKEIGDLGLLYEWRGAEPSLEPVILCAHFDVVPAEDADQWARPPFAGEIAEGFVWGRGSLDDKGALASILDAAERLLERGFAPRRTVYFAFGGDEELGGHRGARAIADWLSAQGVRASFLVDEGGAVADGLVSFADRPLALVGIAEKGYIDLALVAEGKGGHAAMPPRRSATGALARAVASIEDHPAPARLTYTMRNFLDRLAPYVGFPIRLLFRNLWLTGPAVRALFAASPMTNSLVRTTMATTMLEGSPGPNVLADRARAIVNARILPGESSAAVLERAGRLASEHGVEARPAQEGLAVEPLPESPVDHEGYRAVEAALAAAFPEAACVPFLVGMSTDTKNYRDVAKAMFRVLPLRLASSDLAGLHGRDERVAVDNLRRCAIFYRELLGGM